MEGAGSLGLLSLREHNEGGQYKDFGQWWKMQKNFGGTKFNYDVKGQIQRDGKL